MYTPIRDYAVIGNLRSAILVSKDGSIDWAPAPFIDSPSVFAALLDSERGGSWRIALVGDYTTTQKYLPNTNILVTTFTGAHGVLEVTDFIPIEKERTYVPAEENTTFRIHRKVTCVKGVCAVRIVFNPRLNYARDETLLECVDDGVHVKDSGGKVHCVLASPVAFTKEGEAAVGAFELKGGESYFSIFRYNAREIVPHGNGRDHHETELENVRAFWQDWVHKCDLKVCRTSGPWHGMTLRSSLLLKILFFEPFGTIAAAPTTSLPEAIGGVRNWDYRFSWVRDSAFTLQAFFRLGHTDEAEEYFRWLMHECESIASDISTLQIMYGLRGERKLDEEILPHLEGYRGSKPVRIGNAAYDQKQHDIYGSILDTAWQLHVLEKGHVIDAHAWRLLRAIADHAASVWREPDEGLWEVRGGKQHFVHSKVMCWVALDRALKLKDAYGYDGDGEKWKGECDAIKNAVFAEGWSEEKRSFTQSFGSDNLDASLLLLPTLGFIAGDDPRMVATVERIQKDLGAGSEGLLYRYRAADGLPGEEGAFLFASFWLVDALIHIGQPQKAKEIFEKVCGLANHVGLFSEEIDSTSLEFLGNFPQAFTHIGLINSAFNLADAGADL